MEKKYKGLNNHEVNNNQKLYGLNIISNNSKNKFIQILKNPIILLLVLIIILYIFFNQTINSIIILGITIIIIIINFILKQKINKLSNQLIQLNFKIQAKLNQLKF